MNETFYIPSPTAVANKSGPVFGIANLDRIQLLIVQKRANVFLLAGEHTGHAVTVIQKPNTWQITAFLRNSC